MISYQSLLLSTIVLNDNIVLIVTSSRLSIAQLSSPFKYLNMRTFTYATPILITEALHLITQVQLLSTSVTAH